MLAKLWKKILLAICIIACIYNVMNKIVNRHSLSVSIDSVKNTGTILGNYIDDKKSEQTYNTIEGVISTNTTSNNQVESKNIVTIDLNETNSDEVVEEETTENTDEENTSNTNSGKSIDDVIDGLFKKDNNSKYLDLF